MRPEDLLLAPRNARHGDVGAISQAIEAVGFTAPIIVQRSTMSVIAGNHRLKAAMALGMDSIPVMLVDVDDATAARMMIADNRIAQLATWDEEMLSGQLEALAAADLLAGTGYDEEDLEALVRSVHGGSAEPAAREDGVIDASTSLRYAVNGRNGVHWLTARQWRSERYADGLKALKVAKDTCDPVWLQTMVADLEGIAGVVEAALPGVVLSCTPPRDSAFKGGANFASEAGKMLAARLGLEWDGGLFEHRTADRKGHHPRREKGPPEVLRAPPNVILVDDMATSGATIEQSVSALRARGSKVSALVWIYSKVSE